jgi:hypothetical protein
MKKLQHGGTSVILAVGRLRQEDKEFHTGLGFIARSCVKNK